MNVTILHDKISVAVTVVNEQTEGYKAIVIFLAPASLSMSGKRANRPHTQTHQPWLIHGGYLLQL
jgi:hypothetical protein